ncbi:hypothetical protein MASR1M8_27570 [Thermomonas brevis]
MVGGQLVGDHHDGLRHVEQGGVGAGGAAGLAHAVVGQVALADYLHLVEIGRGSRVSRGVGRVVGGEGRGGQRKGQAERERGAVKWHEVLGCLGAARHAASQAMLMRTIRTCN